MKSRFALVIAIIFGISLPVCSQVTPGSVVEESIDNFLSTPASNYSVEIPIVIVRYLPTIDGVNIDVAQATDFWWLGYITLDALKSNIDISNKRTKFSLEEGTKYHGYKDANANPFLGYRVLKYLTVYRQVQPGDGIGTEAGVNLYQPDYKKEFDDLNLTSFIRDNHVKEVWLWYGEPARPNWPSYNAAIHSGIPKSVSFVESNMSSPTTGDISNSNRNPNDLYVFDHTYIVYSYNFRRSQAENVHVHGHQLESMYSYMNTRQDGNTKLFWQDFVGRGPNFEAPIGRAGDCHQPPNTKTDYDYLNTTLVESDIEDWKPAGGSKKQVSVLTWENLVYNWPGSTTFSQKAETQWYIYWMQNMPGANSFIPYNSNVITNWWKFTADWDYCYNNRVGLYEPLSQLPANAGTISGTTAVCQGQNMVVYTVPAIAFTTSYIWSLPTGATGTSSTNSITVNYGPAAVSGNISVKGNNALGDGVPSILAINVTPLLGSAGAISGDAIACQGQNNFSYTVPVMPGASSYIWTLPSGSSGSSITNTISVNYGISAASGNISVKGRNLCGDGTTSSVAITVNPLPSGAGSISGATNACHGQNNILYSVSTIADADYHVWTLPGGASGSSTTNNISVSYGESAVSGLISVKGVNFCGEGVPANLQITMYTSPSGAGAISGASSVCQGQNSVFYSVPSVVGATSYTWTLPEGATGSSTINNITVSYGVSAVSGPISVKGVNSCGEGAPANLQITMYTSPSVAGVISGASLVCQGQNSITYSIPMITEADSYVWTLPAGATGTSTTKNITVNYSLSATSGNVSVRGKNSCGEGSSSALPITVNTKPINPIITLIGGVLYSDASTGNQWYNQNGILNGAVHQDYDVIVDGEYYDVVTVNNCSSNPSNSINISHTGIVQSRYNQTTKVYPNPVSDRLSIELIGITRKLKFEILNSLGQVIHKGNIIEKAVTNTSSLAPGVYSLRLDNGENFKIIKIAH